MTTWRASHALGLWLALCRTISLVGRETQRKQASHVWNDKSKASESIATLEALDRSLAVIEFDPRGNILSANANFCKAMGYEPAELKGRHHSMFVEAGYADTGEYREFWKNLGAGQYQSAEYKRIGKGGRVVWIQGSYNPVLDARGHVQKIVKFASDVTAQKLQSAEAEAKMNAVSRAQR